MLVINYQGKKSTNLLSNKIPKNNTLNLPVVDVNIDKRKKRMKSPKNKVSIKLPSKKKI